MRIMYLYLLGALAPHLLLLSLTLVYILNYYDFPVAIIARLEILKSLYKCIQFQSGIKLFELSRHLYLMESPVGIRRRVRRFLYSKKNSKCLKTYVRQFL